MEFNPNSVDIDEIMLYKKASDEEKWKSDKKKKDKKIKTNSLYVPRYKRI